VDLNSETISLTLTPSLNEEQDVVGEMLSAAQYIKIDGTFSAPIATLDTKKAVSNVIHSGVAKLAEKAGLNISDSKKKIGAYHLCMNVLGRQSKGEVLALYKEAEKKKKLIAIEPVEQTEQKPDLSPKEQFKNQLLKSISDALQ
jgi:ACT domain-containing protein